MLLTNKNHLIAMLSSALQGLAQERGLGEVPTPRLERPKAVDHGDVACNIALQLSKAWKLNPRELAQTLVERLQQQPGFDQLISLAKSQAQVLLTFALVMLPRRQLLVKFFLLGPILVSSPRVALKYRVR